MKVSSLLNHFNAEMDDRKRALQRKEVGEAYKKNAKYADPNKNPMLQALENLLSGKTEKELHELDSATRQESQSAYTEAQDLHGEKPEVSQEIAQQKQTDQEVIAHENVHKLADSGVTDGVLYTHTTGPDNERYITGSEVSVEMPDSTGEAEDTISLLEKVRQAALAPEQPSPQDLRVAASAQVQIQQVRSDLSGESIEEQQEIEPYVDADLSFEMPARFQKDFVNDRNAQEQTIFGQDLEKLLFQRSFNKATAKYSAHISMVNNGYRSEFEPKLSISA